MPDFSSSSSQSGIAGRIRGWLGGLWIRSYLLGLALMLVVGGSYAAFMNRGNAQSQAAGSTYVAVTRRTLTSSVKAAGTVTFASEQQLKFNQKGTVTKVNVKVGDTVKQGQVLAELDKTSVLSDIRQNQLAIAATELQIKQMQADSQKTVIDAQNALQTSQRQLSQAQNDLTVSQQKLPSDLASAQRAVEDKKAALLQAQLNLDKTRSTEVQNLALTAQNALASGDKLLDSLYSVLTRNKSARPSFGNGSDLTIDPLLYNDQNLAQAVTFDYQNASRDSVSMHNTYGSGLTTSRQSSTILQALTDADQFAKDISTLSEDTYAMMQGASTDTTNFTADALNTLRGTVSTDRASASTLVNTVETAQANLAATSSAGGIPSVTLKAAEDAVTTAQHDVDAAQENLSVLQKQNPATLQQQQAAVAAAQDTLHASETNVGSTSTDTSLQLQLKENSVAQQVASLQKTEQSLQDYQLVAPFDGVVTHIDYKVRDNLLDTGDTEFATIQNPAFILITIPLDQVDVVRVRTGMTADIALDALPGTHFQGTVSQIDASPIQQSGVVSYNVSVKMPTPPNTTILSGMTATVTIQTSSKQNVLAVPNLAIRYIGGSPMVQLASGQSVPVQTGDTDGQYTEILSGVQEGDRVLSVNVSVQTSSSGNAAQQLFRLGGGGFGGGGGGFGGGARGGGGGGGRGG